MLSDTTGLSASLRKEIAWLFRLEPAHPKWYCLRWIPSQTLRELRKAIPLHFLVYILAWEYTQTVLPFCVKSALLQQAEVPGVLQHISNLWGHWQLFKHLSKGTLMSLTPWSVVSSWKTVFRSGLSLNSTNWKMCIEIICETTHYFTVSE